MKLVFAGTPPFAAAALAALADAGHEIVAVLTQPQKPKGRGMVMQPSAVAHEATRRGMTVMTPPTLKDPAIQALLASLHADVMVVAAYGLLLPQAVLDIPRWGCLNIHGSLLPRWRGAAPVQRAIEAGDRETGIAIMQMDAGLDTGAVLLEKRVAIAPDDTSTTLFATLTDLGAAAIVEALARLDTLTPVQQADEGATYAKKILKTEAPINWALPAVDIERRIRAFDPFPGAETMHCNTKLKVWRAVTGEKPSNAAPGLVFGFTEQGPMVATGDGALTLTALQKPGAKRMGAVEFLRGHPMAVGTVLV
jgi:methionyl-tRNA formyltransferase